MGQGGRERRQRGATRSNDKLHSNSDHETSRNRLHYNSSYNPPPVIAATSNDLIKISLFTLEINNRKISAATSSISFLKKFTTTTWLDRIHRSIESEARTGFRHLSAPRRGRSSTTQCVRVYARVRRDNSDSSHETTRTGEISHANIIVRVSEVSFRNLCSAGRMGDYVKRCVSGYSGREARRNRDTAR